MPALLAPLPENAGLAFIGESEWPAAIISEHQAEAFAAAQNPAGRPNSDVLRSFIGKTGQRLNEHWQIDFPPHYREQEAALYELPYAHLRKTAGPGSGSSWWINPHAQLPLRHALARLDRFLASPPGSSAPAWSWFESSHLPDASLLVVARDDDFTQAILRSAAFATWWRVHSRKDAAVQIVASFPFPWPITTPLGSLNRLQQEIRSHAARAVLSGDHEQINSAIAAAYGWPRDQDESKILERLRQLYTRQSGPAK